MSLERSVDQLVMAVWGQTGTNGLVGTQAKHAERISKLELFQTEIMVLWKVIRWMALCIVALVGFLSTDTLARIALDIAKALNR